MDWGLAKFLGSAPRNRTGTLRGGAVDAQPFEHGSRRGARAERGERRTTRRMDTLEGEVLGTPAYMPPEQARGRLEEMGPRSDIYSVGAMLYHLLRGACALREQADGGDSHDRDPRACHARTARTAREHCEGSAG